MSTVRSDSCGSYARSLRVVGRRLSVVGGCNGQLNTDNGQPPSHAFRAATRAYARTVARQAFLLFFIGLVGAAHAQSYAGQNLLAFAANYVIAPLGIFSIVLALAGSVFRPDLVKGAVYAALISAVLFFIIKMAPQLTTALKA